MFIILLPPFTPSPSFAYLIIMVFTQGVEGSVVHVVLIAETSFFQEPDCIVLPLQQEIISQSTWSAFLRKTTRQFSPLLLSFGKVDRPFV